MANASLAKIASAMQRAAAGVDYSPRHGASCPWCGSRTKIVRTFPEEDGSRIRYHRCDRDGCTLARFGTLIKSIDMGE